MSGWWRGDTVVAMPTGPRLTWRIVAASSIIALAASVGSFVLLDHRGGGAASPTVELTPDAVAPTIAGASFTTFAGEKVALTSLRGTPTVVNFFSSTCAPCIKEMPAFQQVSHDVGSQVRFLGLAVADRPEDAQALVKRTGVTYRTAQDADGSVITALGGTVLPTTVLLDAAGHVVATHSGELTAAELRALLADKLHLAL